MSCVTCDGAGEIDPPPHHSDVLVHGWILTGNQPTPCPVCRGPHVKAIVAKADVLDQVIECAADDCDEPAALGSIVYTQLTSSKLPSLDEAICLCCDRHAWNLAEEFRRDGHPTICLPFFIDDAREAGRPV